MKLIVKRTRSEIKHFLVLCVIGFLIAPSASHGSSEAALNALRQEFANAHPGQPLPWEMPLTGTANGGVLYLMREQPFWLRSVSIQTTQGESAEVVLKRLASKVNEDKTDPFGWHLGVSGLPTTGAQVADDTLILPASLPYAFSTTDSGFDLPKPVMSVSAMYDAEKRQVNMWWINPPEPCDEILACGTKIPPGSTHYVADWSDETRKTNGIFEGWLGITVKRGKISSPPANIDITVNSQEELTSFPFYMGIAPNWSTWYKPDKPDGAMFLQGIKPWASLIANIGSSSEKPFYQIVKITEKGVQAGVWRRFLGLTPGHTYQVEVRLNTLEMDACTNAWTFSFHAAHDYPGGKGLTEAQMAGQTALPDGSKGAEPGRIALYEQGVTTKGKWAKRSTDQPGPGLVIRNITLPKDVTSITVWLRHSGANSTGVGMDWVKLTDVTENH